MPLGGQDSGRGSGDRAALSSVPQSCLATARPPVLAPGAGLRGGKGLCWPLDAGPSDTGQLRRGVGGRLGPVLCRGLRGRGVSPSRLPPPLPGFRESGSGRAVVAQPWPLCPQHAQRTAHRLRGRIPASATGREVWPALLPALLGGWQARGPGCPPKGGRATSLLPRVRGVSVAAPVCPGGSAGRAGGARCPGPPSPQLLGCPQGPAGDPGQARHELLTWAGSILAALQGRF